MKKRKSKKTTKKKPGSSPSLHSSVSAFNMHSKFSDLSKQIEKIYRLEQNFDERIQDIEVHVNLLTRLLTTLCIEKFGMRIGVLKRLIKRIEKEVIRDSQILHLEALYKLPLSSEKKALPRHLPRATLGRKSLSPSNHLSYRFYDYVR